jgi:hypothetical protein
VDREAPPAYVRAAEGDDIWEGNLKRSQRIPFNWTTAHWLDGEICDWCLILQPAAEDTFI